MALLGITCKHPRFTLHFLSLKIRQNYSCNEKTSIIIISFEVPSGKIVKIVKSQ